MGCSYCHKSGHNIKTCPERLAEQAGGSGNVEDSPAPRITDRVIDAFNDNAPMDNPNIVFDFGDLGDSHETSTLDEYTDSAKKALQKMGEKAEKILEKQKPIALSEFIAIHILLNDVSFELHMWFTSPDLVGISNDVGKGKDINWGNDPRLGWYRDHYKFWKLLYPDLLKWINVEKIYFPIIFIWTSCRIAMVRYQLTHPEKEIPIEGNEDVTE